MSRKTTRTQNRKDGRMPTYAVEITRTLELSTTITVTATTEEDARVQAAQLAENATLAWESDGTYEWETLVDVVCADDIHGT